MGVEDELDKAKVRGWRWIRGSRSGRHPPRWSRRRRIQRGKTTPTMQVTLLQGLTDEHAPHGCGFLVSVHHLMLGLRSATKRWCPILRDYVRIAWSKDCVLSSTFLNLKFLSLRPTEILAFLLIGNLKPNTKPSATRCAHPASNTSIQTMERWLCVAVARKWRGGVYVVWG